ncbi:acetyl-CoA C-acetyltransferase [Micrococcales bacterium 31B]|nr:acetyl-CoA C-acetyltransferase [Micrococcales bacterium 31B]
MPTLPPLSPRDAVIVSTARSPIGRAFKGSLTQVRPDDLSAAMARAALDAAGVDPADLLDTYWGCAEPAHEQGYNLARIINVLLGLDHVGGATINRFCASSLQTLRMATHAIRCGEGDVFLTGGVEMVSRYPNFHGAGQGSSEVENPLFDAAKERVTAQLAAPPLSWSDPRAQGGLPQVYLAMGLTAEFVAAHSGVSREEQDEWALSSQQRAAAAIASGRFAREITPFTLADGTIVDRDDSPRPGTTAEGLTGLAPAFIPHGSVTAGNCCPLSDGAAALVVTSNEYAAAHGLTPLARVVSTGVSGLSPEVMGLGPIESTRRALATAGLEVADLDAVEINEAFAVQVVASYRTLGLDPERVNIAGGAIALGHPFGSTGARIVTTLLHNLRERDGELGAATMCVGGGQGMAVILQRL